MEHIFLFSFAALLAIASVRSQNYYNVLSPKDFESFKSSSVPCAVHFVTKSPEKMKRDWRMKEFQTNFVDSARYLEDFDVKFATIDCTADPVEEFCSQKNAEKTLSVFSFGQVLTKLPMDGLYNVDAIVSNLLHLVLLREVPFIQDPMDLTALQQKVKGRKDILFAKLLAVGTPEHRAFVEGAFAYSHLYQFVMTSNMETNMLGPGLEDEWKETRDRVWLLNCKQATVADPCQRSFYRGKMTVLDFALYLKTLDLQPYVEYKSSSATIFYQRLGIPTIYLYSDSAEYEVHRTAIRALAQTFRGNLGFVLVNSDVTPESVVAGSERCQSPCLMLQRAPQETLIQMGGALTAESISAFIEDNMYVQAEHPRGQLDEEEHERIPVQELQDDEVQFAVFRDSRVLDTSHVAKLTDKTFPEFIANAGLVVVLFTVRWDPRCKAFLEVYSAAAETIRGDATLGRPATGPLAEVKCFSWTDVCQRSNVTAYPTVKLYTEGKAFADYKGSLSEQGILKAYRLYSTASPLVLGSCSDCRAFSRGKLPSWASSVLQAVVTGVFPESATKEKSEYQRAAKMLQGQQLMGICPGDCADHMTGADVSRPTVTVFKWEDSHQQTVEYTGDYSSADLLQFVQAATLPLVPQLTPSTFPLHFSRGKPFLILFKDLDEQSEEAEASFASLAKAKTFASELVILWMDVSQPVCVGSEILRDYGIRRQSMRPSVVFVDHRGSRVCNYPPDFSLTPSAVADWVVIVLKGETSCSGLREGTFKPRVSPYDFLAFIRDSKKDPVGQRMGRLPMDRHHPAEDWEELEDEEEEGGSRYMPDARPDKHHHTEL